MDCQTILDQLRAQADPNAVANAKRYGSYTTKSYGISSPKLHDIAKSIGKNHTLATQLWATAIDDARIVAVLIDDPKQVTEAQMEAWAKDFDNWGVVDGACSILFDKTPFAYQKATEWSSREEEFVKRAGFVLMAVLAVHDKRAKDEIFLPFLPIIKRESHDERNFVKKAVNWALRQIGKRNLALNEVAIQTGLEIQALGTKAGRWTAADALRELRSEAVQTRLQRKKK